MDRISNFKNGFECYFHFEGEKIFKFCYDFNMDWASYIWSYKLYKVYFDGASYFENLRSFLGGRSRQKLEGSHAA